MLESENSPFAAEPRRPAYCLRCQEELTSTAVHCHRCGLEFNWADPRTYRLQSDFLLWRFWFPGFCLAVVSGVLSYAVVLITGGQMGFALFIAVPISFGAVLGYATRASIWVALALALAVIPSVLLALLSMEMSGFFCGITLALIFVAPGLCGVLLGFLLRVILKFSRWDQRSYLPLVFLLLVPYATDGVERLLPREKTVATVRTGLTVQATPEEAFAALQFYEDVQHEPPALLKLALPKPQRSIGSKAVPGDRVRCLYDRGYIVKEITEVEPGRRLAFTVVEQHLHFEHDVRLLGGSFEFVPVPGGGTRMVLTTRYEKQLRPERLWGPIEREVIHTLHRHVLEGIRREAERPPEEPYSPPPPRDRTARLP